MSVDNFIKISTDFSEYPGVRYPKQGDNSGEEFREQLLVPKLKLGGQLTVDLNDTKGLGSSFLEEAFGGAVRQGYALSRENIAFICDDEATLNDLWEYISQAMKVRAQNLAKARAQTPER